MGDERGGAGAPFLMRWRALFRRKELVNSAAAGETHFGAWLLQHPDVCRRGVDRLLIPRCEREGKMTSGSEFLIELSSNYETWPTGSAQSELSVLRTSKSKVFKASRTRPWTSLGSVR